MWLNDFSPVAQKPHEQTLMGRGVRNERPLSGRERAKLATAFELAFARRPEVKIPQETGKIASGFLGDSSPHSGSKITNILNGVMIQAKIVFSCNSGSHWILVESVITHKEFAVLC